MLNVLVPAGVVFALSLISLVLLKLNLKSRTKKPERSALYKRITFATLWSSTGLVFASALSTTQTFAMLQHSTTLLQTAEVNIVPGAALQGLQWAAFAVSFVYASVLWIMLKIENIESVPIKADKAVVTKSVQGSSGTSAGPPAMPGGF